MSEIQKEALVKMCGVWLCITDADETRFKFWSQILGCNSMELVLEFKKVQYLIDPKNKDSIKHKDVFLTTLFNEVKDLPVENIKSLFNKLRKES